MRLTENFELWEFLKSDTANYHKIDNTPSPSAQVNLSHLARSLQGFRDYIGKPLVITSGYRSPALNRAVGGAKNSWHTKGLAADFYCPGLTSHQLWQSFNNYRKSLDYDPFIEAIKYSTPRIHVAIKLRK